MSAHAQTQRETDEARAILERGDGEALIRVFGDGGGKVAVGMAPGVLHGGDVEPVLVDFMHPCSATPDEIRELVAEAVGTVWQRWTEVTR